RPRTERGGGGRHVYPGAPRGPPRAATTDDGVAREGAQPEAGELAVHLADEDAGVATHGSVVSHADEAVALASEAPRLGRAVGAAGDITVNSAIKESSFAVKQAKSLSQAAQRDVDNLVSALRSGNANPGLGTKALGN